MRAVLKGSDKKLHWTEVPDTQIKDDEVLLEIHAAALNRADLLQRAGQYPPPDGWPEWFGLEAAGVICAMGKKVEAEGKWHIGDQVCALLGGGGYAEYVAVPAGMLMPVPNGLGMVEAAAMPEVYGAAYLFLFYEGFLKAGDTLLVQAGGSGLASVLIPMAKAFGARVITTVLSDEVAKSIEHLHADLVINTSKGKLADVMKAGFEAGRSVDIAIDCLGGETVGECLTWAVCCLSHEEMKRATTEQLEMSGFIEERLEEIELHMHSNAEPLNQYMSDSPYLLGHIPDKMDDDFSPLFSENP